MMTDPFRTYRDKITRKDMAELPIGRCTDPIELVCSPEAAAEAAVWLRTQRLLGFDTETRPAFRKGQHFLPAVLQLAGEGRTYVFQLQHTGFPECLQVLLSMPTLTKTGVAVADDIKGLREHADFEPGGFVDTGDIARQLKLGTHGLRNLAANLLGFRISKSAQTSNWAVEELSEKQVVYAATDAWVSRLIHLRMKELGMLDAAHRAQN